MWDLVIYVFNGLLGGLASSLLWAKGWSEIKSYESLRGIILGAIGGYVFFWMHTQYSVPNGVVAFAWGYAFKDIISSIIERFAQPKQS